MRLAAVDHPGEAQGGEGVAGVLDQGPEARLAQLPQPCHDDPGLLLHADQGRVDVVDVDLRPGPGLHRLDGELREPLGADADDDVGQQVERAHAAPDVSADRLRADVVTPFRSASQGVLVVDGPGLLGDDLRGFWNFSVWVEHDPERDADWSFVATGRKDPLGAPREVASVLFDDADPERPRRLFADSC